MVCSGSTSEGLDRVDLLVFNGCISEVLWFCEDLNCRVSSTFGISCLLRLRVLLVFITAVSEILLLSTDDFCVCLRFAIGTVTSSETPLFVLDLVFGTEETLSEFAAFTADLVLLQGAGLSFVSLVFAAHFFAFFLVLCLVCRRLPEVKTNSSDIGTEANLMMGFEGMDCSFGNCFFAVLATGDRNCTLLERLTGLRKRDGSKTFTGGGGVLNSSCSPSNS